ncbi:uncharacterized protein BX664DRAFT_44613 [Halteromyces radiatus]|uniref:uncharacterized protein n=1 Tax=Halteromyces radiatus TaxID=101107 RepID=UPI00221E66DE|nr:uncharacterized protein BX664DRAFT_44613 [Halteromyces radiatus]KAI8077830.1 hypothetical protein BX664DRAFT_44613 [Halteromyces radiatus]
MFTRWQKAGPLLQHVRYKSNLTFGRIHGLNGNKRYPVSFLSTEDLGDKKLTDYPEFIIGWTPKQDEIDSKTFMPNDTFLNYLTQVFSNHIHEINDSTLKGMAQYQKEGWLHIGDERNPPPWGRIPKPEDIIGSVLLQDGKIQAGTYQSMPAYRLATKKGFMQLSKPLEQYLVDVAKQKLK